MDHFLGPKFCFHYGAQNRSKLNGDPGRDGTMYKFVCQTLLPKNKILVNY